MGMREDLAAMASEVAEGLATGSLTITHQTHAQIGATDNGRPGFSSGKTTVTVRAVALANIDELATDIAGGRSSRDIPFRISRKDLEAEGMTLHELMSLSLRVSYQEDADGETPGLLTEKLTVQRVTPDAGRQGLIVVCRL